MFETIIVVFLLLVLIAYYVYLVCENIRFTKREEKRRDDIVKSLAGISESLQEIKQYVFIVADCEVKRGIK